MTAAASLDIEHRAAVHRALGEVKRLAIIDELARSDRTPSELGAMLDLPSNLLTFHVDELERVGLVRRVTSDGDRRRRYLQLATEPLPAITPPGPTLEDGTVLFVCTHNAARSQLAAALWAARSGRDGVSAGTDPADRVHQRAIEVAAAHGLDLTDARPRHLEDVDVPVALVVTVCDRAHEAGRWPTAPIRHWSVPDPLESADPDAFERAYTLIDRRVDRLVAEVSA